MNLEFKQTYRFIVLAVITVLGVTACQKDDNEGDDNARKAIVETYANIVYANYTDAVSAAQELKAAAQNLVMNPSAANLLAAQNAYIASRTPYGQTDAFRFYGGPIDDEDGKEGLLNGWPLDEAYIDYVAENATSGIINDSITYPTINKALIESLNEVGGETNLSSGYHAIEFLLWGQDFYADSPGKRPFTDYLANAVSGKRRGQYLLAACDLLIDDLTYTANAWAPNASNYRASFVKQNSAIAIKLILQGIGKFTKGELYGERMSTAYGTQSQEDEHSCFSDQTHMDFVLGQQGIANVYYGMYTRKSGVVLSGASLSAYLKTENASLAAEFETKLSNCKTAVGAIQPPFDQEILNSAGRQRVLNAINAGNEQALGIVALASFLGIDIAL